MAAQRPSGCCGVCPETASGGYDCTCAGNPRCHAQQNPPEVEQ